MNDIESEYVAYQYAKSIEGGLRDGRKLKPERGLLFLVAATVGTLLLGGLLLSMLH